MTREDIHTAKVEYIKRVLAMGRKAMISCARAGGVTGFAKCSDNEIAQTLWSWFGADAYYREQKASQTTI